MTDAYVVDEHECLAALLFRETLVLHTLGVVRNSRD